MLMAVNIQASHKTFDIESQYNKSAFLSTRKSNHQKKTVRFSEESQNKRTTSVKFVPELTKKRKAELFDDEERAEAFISKEEFWDIQRELTEDPEFMKYNDEKTAIIKDHAKFILKATRYDADLQKKYDFLKIKATFLCISLVATTGYILINWINTAKNECDEN